MDFLTRKDFNALAVYVEFTPEGGKQEGTKDLNHAMFITNTGELFLTF